MLIASACTMDTTSNKVIGQSESVVPDDEETEVVRSKGNSHVWSDDDDDMF